MDKVINKEQYERFMGVFQELDSHLIRDEKPSKYVDEISNSSIFKEYPFSMIYRLKETEQSPTHHPEGSAFEHTKLVLDEAAKVRNRAKDIRSFMWAALLHDIGKPDTTRLRKGRITSYDHDKVGAELAKEFLTFFGWDNELIYPVEKLVWYHMHILYFTKDMAFGNKKDIIKEVDVEDLALLGLCDRLGRLNVNVKAEEETIQLFLQKVKKIK